jgi:hypothetical protein
VVTEKQVPGLFVGFDASALKRRRQIKHDNVRVVVSENGRQVVPADGVRPILKKSFDPGFYGGCRYWHGLDSQLFSEDERRLASPTRSANFFPRI